MSGKKLLVADDSLTIQKVIRLALSHEGYEIQTVSEGNAAVEQLLLFRPQVVLIDVSLPGKTAVEVKRLCDQHPELSGTHFVLMSSAFEQVDQATTQAAGFHGELTKPFDPAHLRRVLSECLESQSDLDEAPRLPPLPSHSAGPRDFPPLPDLPPLMSQPEPHLAPPALDLPLLWDSPSKPASPAPLAPPPPPPMAPTPAAQAAHYSEGSEDDIRELTQSTLKMAGLEEMEWTVNERSKRETLTPEPTLVFKPEPTLPPLPKMSLGGTPSQAPSAAQFLPPDEPVELSPPLESPLQPAQIEAMVREQVEAAVLKLSRELLPQIAERLIKQEIHRMLNEGP